MRSTFPRSPTPPPWWAGRARPRRPAGTAPSCGHIQWSPGVAPLDPWVLLGAIAQVTERVRLGTLVTPLSRRCPHVVAKHLTTLDHLSGGRAVLGVGLGEPVDRDFGDLGDEVDARVRAAMLDESLELIDQLMRVPTDFTGEHYRIKADLHPRPVQRPRRPIWVAGVVPNRKPLARALRWDGVAPVAPGRHLTPDELAAHLARLESPPRAGWEIVVHRLEGIPAQEYAEAGATWLVYSPSPTSEGWESEITEMIRTGP
ncbi:LLM class flavin-dependent oxidoreductase [Georgenia subflava]